MRDGIYQPFGIFLLGMCKYLFHISTVHNISAFHYEDPLTQLPDQAQIMRYEQYGSPVLYIDPLK